MPIEVASASALYNDHVNPQWVKLLDVLGMNVRYTRCSGAELSTEEEQGMGPSYQLDESLEELSESDE